MRITYSRDLAVGTVVILRIGCVRRVTSGAHSGRVRLTVPESQPDPFGEAVKWI